MEIQRESTGIDSANDIPTYELLARHLWPRFNIYEPTVDDEDGILEQSWTAEMKDAVTRYLLDELPADVTPYLFGLDAAALENSTTKRKAVDLLLDSSPPWEVAYAVRQAAVKAVPTLDDLLGHLDEWPSGEERADVATWLDAHATGKQRSLVAESAHLPVDTRDRHPDGQDLAWNATPQRLIKVWHDVTGSAPTDLTDAEWELLVPLLSQKGSKHVSAERAASWVQGRRRAYNGIRFKFANDIPWPAVPIRYGRAYSVVYARYNLDKKHGVFERLTESLRGTPEAADLVHWLEELQGGNG